MVQNLGSITFFNEVRLNVEIVDAEGKSHWPREWFEAPIEVIEEAVNLIVNDDMEAYYYDSRIEAIVAK